MVPAVVAVVLDCCKTKDWLVTDLNVGQAQFLEHKAKSDSINLIGLTIFISHIGYRRKFLTLYKYMFLLI